MRRYRSRQRTKRCPEDGCEALIHPDSVACADHTRQVALAKGRDGYYLKQVEAELRDGFIASGEPVPQADELKRLAGKKVVQPAQAYWSDDPVERERQYDEITRRRRVSGRAERWRTNREPQLRRRRLMDYILENPGASTAVRSLKRLETALATEGKPRRGRPSVTTVLTEMDQEGITKLINEAALSRLDKHGRKGRPTASLEHWYATTWSVATDKASTVRRLIVRPRGPGAPFKQLIPDDFRSPWGMIELTAVAYLLRRSGQSHAEIARRFGWNSELQTRRHNPVSGGNLPEGGDHFRLVTAFITMARKLRLKRGADGKRVYSGPWKQALANADRYLAENG